MPGRIHSRNIDTVDGHGFAILEYRHILNRCETGVLRTVSILRVIALQFSASQCFRGLDTRINGRAGKPLQCGNAASVIEVCVRNHDC